MERGGMPDKYCLKRNLKVLPAEAFNKPLQVWVKREKGTNLELPRSVLALWTFALRNLRCQERI